MMMSEFSVPISVGLYVKNVLKIQKIINFNASSRGTECDGYEAKESRGFRHYTDGYRYEARRYCVMSGELCYRSYLKRKFLSLSMFLLVGLA